MTKRTAGATMKLAILFWCYKELGICRDRLRHLRRQDPDAPIFVLFGGEPSDGPAWREALQLWVDDFYVFDDPPPPGYAPLDGYRGGTYWKYLHGDLMWAAWYRDRGAQLEWDTIVVVQWDMLLYGRVSDTFACLRPGQILLSGLRPVAEVERTWLWVKGEVERATYDRFLERVRREHGHDQEPLCCLAIVVCLPRLFLQKLLELEHPEQGGLEYRLPIWAQVFGVPFCTDHPFAPWWAAVERGGPAVTLTARPQEIWAPTIACHLLRRRGARVFHPYWRRVPRGVLGWTWALLDSVPRLLITSAARALLGNRWLRLRPTKG